MDILYPVTCPMCGKVLRQAYRMDREIGASMSVGGYNAPICGVCYKHLPRTEEGKERGNMVEGIFMERRRFVRGGAFLFFEKGHPVQDLVHAMKFRRHPEVGYYLGTLMADEWLNTGFFDDIDVIVPVPLHPTRLRERGYNQCIYIARGISDVTGIPIEEQAVVRVKKTLQQALQTKGTRAENVEGAFLLKDENVLRKKHVLIVDDLITTGATMGAMMDALKHCYGVKYSVLSLGKAI